MQLCCQSCPPCLLGIEDRIFKGQGLSVKMSCSGSVRFVVVVCALRLKFSLMILVSSVSIVLVTVIFCFCIDMLYPFHCLVHCSQYDGESHQRFLLAANGHSIHTFNAADGLFLSTWAQCPNEEEYTTKISSSQAIGNGRQDENTERPLKRRKISTSEITVNDSPEITDNCNTGNPKPAAKDSANPAITKMICSSDGTHVVAMCGVEKSILVLALQLNGVLSLRSTRLESLT